MPKFTEIVDSNTDNVCSKDTDFSGCGVAGTKEATKPNYDSFKMRESRALKATFSMPEPESQADFGLNSDSTE